MSRLKLGETFSFGLVRSPRGEGFVVDSMAAERMWLPIIGPTAYCAARYINQIGHYSNVIGANTAEVALCVGVNPTRFSRAIDRLTRFELAHWAEGAQFLALNDHWLPPSDGTLLRKQESQNE